MHTSEAVAEVGRRLDGRGRSVAVIAVDGHSAAGKSTFARELVAQFGAASVAGDDFYRVMDPDLRARLGPEDGVRLYYDWERMLLEAILPLRAGRAATYRPYDWGRNQLSEASTTIEPARLVVVEGLFASRPEFDEVADLSAVVVASATLRRNRQLDRDDATDDWLTRWDEAERWYFEHVRPVDQFDLRVEGITRE